MSRSFAALRMTSREVFDLTQLDSHTSPSPLPSPFQGEGVTLILLRCTCLRTNALRAFNRDTEHACDRALAIIAWAILHFELAGLGIADGHFAASAAVEVHRVFAAERIHQVGEL